MYAFIYTHKRFREGRKGGKMERRSTKREAIEERNGKEMRKREKKKNSAMRKEE